MWIFVTLAGRCVLIGKALWKLSVSFDMFWHVLTLACCTFRILPPQVAGPPGDYECVQYGVGVASISTEGPALSSCCPLCSGALTMRYAKWTNVCPLGLSQHELSLNNIKCLLFFTRKYALLICFKVLPMIWWANGGPMVTQGWPKLVGQRIPGAVECHEAAKPASRCSAFVGDFGNWM